MAVIRYIGLKDLKDDEKNTIRTIIENESYKINRLLPDIQEMVVNIKTLKPEDRKTRRHILNIKVKTPLHLFMAKLGESSLKRSGSHNLTLECHKAMDNLENEIKHKLKADMDTWKKKSESFKKMRP